MPFSREASRTSVPRVWQPLGLSPAPFQLVQPEIQRRCAQTPFGKGLLGPWQPGLCCCCCSGRASVLPTLKLVGLHPATGCSWGLKASFMVWGRPFCRLPGAGLCLLGPAADWQRITGEVSFPKTALIPCPLNHALPHKPWGNASLLVRPHACALRMLHLSAVGEEAPAAARSCG